MNDGNFHLAGGPTSRCMRLNSKEMHKFAFTGEQSLTTRETRGILQAAFVADKVASASTLSFVGSVTVVLIAILAIANARLNRWLGAQKTAVLGVSLLGLGEVSASFTTRNIGGLFVTAGFVMGVGVR
jgi:Na+/melibiose symporter-like transporter